jgi:hypothetical protein
LTTNIKSPKVIIVAGKVRIFTKDPKKALISPKRSATQRYVLNPPLTVIPGTKDVAAQKARVNAAHRKIKRMY